MWLLVPYMCDWFSLRMYFIAVFVILVARPSLRISVPCPETEPGSMAVKAQVFTTGLPGNSQGCTLKILQPSTKCFLNF